MLNTSIIVISCHSICRRDSLRSQGHRRLVSLQKMMTSSTRKRSERESGEERRTKNGNMRMIEMSDERERDEEEEEEEGHQEGFV